MGDSSSTRLARTAAVVALIAFAVALATGAAAAATAGEVAEQLDLRGYFVEGGGADDTVNTLERLAAELGDDEQALYLVSLNETPSGGADLVRARHPAAGCRGRHGVCRNV